MGVVTSRDPFQIFTSPKISRERLKLETSILVCMLIIHKSRPTDDKLSLKGAVT